MNNLDREISSDGPITRFVSEFAQNQDESMLKDTNNQPEYNDLRKSLMEKPSIGNGLQQYVSPKNSQIHNATECHSFGENTEPVTHIIQKMQEPISAESSPRQNVFLSQGDT